SEAKSWHAASLRCGTTCSELPCSRGLPRGTPLLQKRSYPCKSSFAAGAKIADRLLRVRGRWPPSPDGTPSAPASKLVPVSLGFPLDVELTAPVQLVHTRSGGRLCTPHP